VCDGAKQNWINQQLVECEFKTLELKKLMDIKGDAVKIYNKFIDTATTKYNADKSEANNAVLTKLKELFAPREKAYKDAQSAHEAQAKKCEPFKESDYCKPILKPF